MGLWAYLHQPAIKSWSPLHLCQARRGLRVTAVQVGTSKEDQFLCQKIMPRNLKLFGRTIVKFDAEFGPLAPFTLSMYFVLVEVATIIKAWLDQSSLNTPRASGLSTITS